MMSRLRTILVGVVATGLMTGMVAIPAFAGVPADSVGVVDQTQGLWYLRDPGSGATTSFYFGNPGDYPIMGDWDCDGIDTPGLYRQSDGFVYLRNTNTQGIANIRFFFGIPGDIPLAGDFNKDGCDTVSIYRPSQARIFVINKLGANDGGLGAADFDFYFGNSGDKPFTADFNDNGQDTVGLHRESTGFVYYRTTLTKGVAHNQFFYGDPGDQIIAGRWTENPTPGPDTVGIFRPSLGTIYLRFNNSQGNADVDFEYGNQATRAVAGNFGELPGGDMPPEPPWVDPFVPPPAPTGFTLTESSSAGEVCYRADWRSFNCTLDAVVDYSGPTTDTVWFTKAAAGEPMPTQPDGLPSTNHGVSSPPANIRESVGIYPNSDVCFWTWSLREYRDNRGDIVARVRSAVVGPECAMVDTRNRITMPGNVPKPQPPTSVSYSRHEAGGIGWERVWFSLTIPEPFAEAYVCIDVETPWLPDTYPLVLPPSCEDISGRGPGTYEVASGGRLDTRSGWTASILVPGATSNPATTVWGTPTSGGGWVPG